MGGRQGQQLEQELVTEQGEARTHLNLFVPLLLSPITSNQDFSLLELLQICLMVNSNVQSSRKEIMRNVIPT